MRDAPGCLRLQLPDPALARRDQNAARHRTDGLTARHRRDHRDVAEPLPCNDDAPGYDGRREDELENQTDVTVFRGHDGK